MEAVKAWAEYAPDGTLRHLHVFEGTMDDIPVRIIREEDWERIETFLRDCANLGEHNAYSDGAAVGNIAERARVLYGVDRLIEDMDRNPSTRAQTQGG